jgi:hypothetical protein
MAQHGEVQAPDDVRPFHLQPWLHPPLPLMAWQNETREIDVRNPRRFRYRGLAVNDIRSAHSRCWSK